MRWAVREPLRGGDLGAENQGREGCHGQSTCRGPGEATRPCRPQEGGGTPGACGARAQLIYCRRWRLGVPQQPLIMAVWGRGDRQAARGGFSLPGGPSQPLSHLPEGALRPRGPRAERTVK